MSRATLIDERQEEETETIDQLEQDTVETPQEEEQPQTEPELPEKYQGKSVEDLVQMHQELERFTGKQSTEVGELRKVVDSYIENQTQLTQQAPEVQQQDEEIDFFVDPQTAVARAIDNHPKIKEAQAYTQQAKKQTALAQLQQQHPDMESVLQDPKFAEWITGSKIRTQLFVRADQEYDYEAAHELFSNWKERNQVVQQTVEVEKAARKNAVKSANTGNARGTGEGTRKKTYRRADIIKLMKSDPDRYMALQPEIMAAYADGRVK
jgi:hypothetical protein